VLPPFLLLSGVFGSQPKFFNTTYRYLINDRNALRLTAGLNVFNSGSYNNRIESAKTINNVTIYKNTSMSSNANFKFGAGYEKILGKRKLKHVVGVDLTYNYVNEVLASDYYGFKDTIYNNIKHTEYVAIDTGRTTTNRYYHKFGITPFYSLRYALSPKWLITASTRLSLQGYRIKDKYIPGGYVTIIDFNTDGLISEICLYYRF